jgi:ubiquinone/menaquinone biosynthesis C-methylase UbiE
MADKVTELNEELWDSRARTYDRAFRFNRWVQKKVVSLMALTDDTRLLEIACGTGWGLRYAARLAGGRGEFYGVDLSSQMIQQARRRSAARQGIYFIKANAEKLPFQDDFFTFVICTNAFHHFSNPGGAIEESARVLKPGGRVYVADATDDMFVVTIIDRLQKKLQPAHVKTYSTREYEEFFRAAGLVYVAHKTVLPVLKIHVAEKH